MSNVTKMHAKLGQAMASGPGAPEQADIPNAVRHRHSLPAQIDMIEVEDRLRSVDEAAVQYIAESMQQQGQLYPIQIRTVAPGRFRLIAGAHRLAAARKLGWTHIEAFLVDDLEEDEARLLEIDENLCRAELRPVEKAHFFSTRKGIYEQLHPETKHGANLVSPNWRHEENTDESPSERAPSFVDDTATSTPWSPRTIQRYTRIGERLDPELREALASTPIGDRTQDLERIADMEPDDQQKLLARLRSADEPPKSLSALQQDPATAAPRPGNVDRLKKLWTKSDEDERTEFREWLDLQGGE